MHQRPGVARHAHGRRGARLHAHDHRFVGQIPAHPAAEGRDALTQSLRDEAGHPLVQTRRRDTGNVRRSGQRPACAARHEIGDPLCRSDLMLPAPLPRRLFEPLLEFQPRQLAPFGTQMFEIRKPDLRDQPRIGIRRRTAAGRHAVDHRLRGIGHRRHDKPARTHAERVDAPSALLAHERIGGCGEVFAAFAAMVLDRIDERLRMLDAHPHGKGLGLDAHAAAVEQFVNIARRMACGEHHGGAFDQAVAAPHTADAALFDLQVRDAAFEAEHAARIDDRLPDVLHDARQTVGADMRMRLVEYFGRRAVEHERLQRLVIVAALLAAREELAVGRRSRPRPRRKRSSNRDRRHRCG